MTIGFACYKQPRKVGVLGQEGLGQDNWYRRSSFRDVNKACSVSPLYRADRARCSVNPVNKINKAKDLYAPLAKHKGHEDFLNI